MQRLSLKESQVFSLLWRDNKRDGERRGGSEGKKYSYLVSLIIFFLRIPNLVVLFLFLLQLDISVCDITVCLYGEEHDVIKKGTDVTGSLVHKRQAFP